MTLKQAKAEEKAQAIERLRAFLPPGSTVYCVLRHISSSGMSRRIDMYTIGEDRQPVYLSGLVSKAIGMRLSDKGGIVVGGCGMGMGMHLVYEMSATLYRDGFGCIGEGCPSNDHSNGDRDYTPHTGAQVRCRKCQDVPGKDGLGKPCKGCGGSGQVESKHDRAHWHKDGGYVLRKEWL